MFVQMVNATGRFQLLGNLTLEDLKHDNYHAYARNKLIAEAFYLTGDIEKYGSGFMRIRKELETYPTIQYLIQGETERILNDPQLAHLIR